MAKTRTYRETNSPPASSSISCSQEWIPSRRAVSTVQESSKQWQGQRPRETARTSRHYYAFGDDADFAHLVTHAPGVEDLCHVGWHADSAVPAGLVARLCVNNGMGTGGRESCTHANEIRVLFEDNNTMSYASQRDRTSEAGSATADDNKANLESCLLCGIMTTRLEVRLAGGERG